MIPNVRTARPPILAARCCDKACSALQKHRLTLEKRVADCVLKDLNPMAAQGRRGRGAIFVSRSRGWPTSNVLVHAGRKRGGVRQLSCWPSPPWFIWGAVSHVEPVQLSLSRPEV